MFDAAFHVTLQPEAYVYPGPHEWLALGIRRYGFHGISFQYATRRATEILGPDSSRLVICHLGNGASIAAVRDGKSVDTTMGFTPLEGLMMGTRSGSIDPGIHHLSDPPSRLHGRPARSDLNRESGLLGVSGVSGDMREILAAIEQGNDRARLAFDIYAHRLCRGIGAMLAATDGADAIVFTGGVGENCAPLRDRVRQQLRGLLKDARELVIHAEEEWEIVRECFTLDPTQPVNFRKLRSVCVLLLERWLLLRCFPIAQAQTNKPAPDEIVFTNGDKLEGHFVRATGAAVTFKSDILGDLTVDWKKVKELRTSAKVAVVRKGVIIRKNGDTARFRKERWPWRTRNFRSPRPPAEARSRFQ